MVCPKWIKDLNLRAKIELSEEHIGLNLHVMEFGSEFTVMTPKHRLQKKKKKKIIGLHRTKNFCVSKDTIMKAKRKPTE